MIVVNETPIDQFTLVHGAAGVAARAAGMSFQTTFALGFAWDYWAEPILKDRFPELFPYPSQDGKCHAFVDALTPAVAWLLADAVIRKGSKR